MLFADKYVMHPHPYINTATGNLVRAIGLLANFSKNLIRSETAS